MDREIKFRGKTINGIWVYGNLSIIPKRIKNIEAGCYISNSAGMPFAYQVIPETIGQYIGTSDKSDKEVYENDIDESGYVIRWSNRLCLFCLQSYSDILQRWGEMSYPIDTERIAIIGNTHDNPELLK